MNLCIIAILTFVSLNISFPFVVAIIIAIHERIKLSVRVETQTVFIPFVTIVLIVLIAGIIFHDVAIPYPPGTTNRSTSRPEGCVLP